MERWVVLWVAACGPIDAGTRAGIQIGQESGGCTIVSTSVAIDALAPSGVRPIDAVPDGPVVTDLTYEEGGQTSLEVGVVVLSSRWVDLEPVDPRSAIDCEQAWLENTIELQLRSGDEQLDERVSVVGRVLEVDGDLVTELKARIDAGALEGTLDLGDALRLGIEGSLTSSGQTDGGLRAEDADGSVRPVGTWMSVP